MAIFKRKITTPEVFQTEAAECGAASLSMILRYFKCELPMEQIREVCGVNRDGCSAADLVMAGRRFGLESKGFKVELEKLKDAPKPCILHWNFNHFVVLERITSKYAVINDPSEGHRKITLAELDDAYTGVILTFTPGPDFKENKMPSGLYHIFKDRMGMDKTAVTYLVLVGVLLMLPGLMLPVLSEKFIDNVLSSSVGYTLSIVSCMGLVYIFQLVFTYYRSAVLSKFKTKIALISSSSLIKKALKLPVAFYDQRYAGELSRRIEINSEVNDFLAGNLTEMFLNVFTSIAYLVLMFIYSPTLALIGIAGAATNIIVSNRVLKPVEELNMKSRQDQCRMSGMLAAGISVADSIKASGVENEYTADIQGVYARTTISEQKLGFTKQIVSALPGACTHVFTVIIMAVGGMYIIRGDITVGALTAFMQLFNSYINPLNQILGFAQSIQQMKAGYAKIEDIENAKIDARFKENEARENSTLNRKLQGRIRVNNLVYGYNTGLAPIVKNLSIGIEPGMRIAIVGSSGSGKTTLGKLISGTLEPWAGQITIDGIPLYDIPHNWLSSSMAVISQKTYIFQGTVRDNLTLWNNEYPEEQIYQAVADADAASIINDLPDTYDCMLSEGGRRLSGGQRQKMEIARALIKDPSIIIMDEATSAMDEISEKKVMSNIRARACTCIIIAHRLSAIRDCDAIIVLDDGNIVEFGTHDQLMANHGLYEQLIMN